jgi:hypothetical protein
LSYAKRKLLEQFDNRWREETRSKLDAIRYWLDHNEEKEQIVYLLKKLIKDIKEDFEES